MRATKLTALGLGTALLLSLSVTAHADEEKVLNFGCAMYTDGMVNSALDENSGWNAMRYGIAEALFKFDDNMEVTPWLAESYEVNEEHTEWTIYLKEGIKFSDGCDLTPTKVKAYFDYLKEMGPIGSAKPEKYLEFEAEVIADDEANTIFIKTSKPYANLMQQLCMNKFVSPTTGATISSAQLGILLALVFMPASTIWSRAIFSAVCAVAGTWILVWFIQHIPFKDPVMVPLVGIMFGNVIGGITNYIAYRYEMTQAISSWLTGSFSTIIRGRYEIVWLTIVGVSKGSSIDYLQDYVTDDDLLNLGTVKEADMEALMESEPDIIFVGGRMSAIYDELVEIAPVYMVYTDTETGVVESTAMNARNIASLFDAEDEVDALLEDYNARIDALASFAEGKTAIVGMVNAGGFGLLGNDGRCSIIGREIGFENVGVDADADTSAHGNEASFEFVLSKNPDYIFAMDRDAAIGTEGAQLAWEVLDNELINKTDAAQNGDVIVLEHSNVWYTAEGGVTALGVMLSDLENALLE